MNDARIDALLRTLDAEHVEPDGLFADRLLASLLPGAQQARRADARLLARFVRAVGVRFGLVGISVRARPVAILVIVALLILSLAVALILVGSG